MTGGDSSSERTDLTNISPTNSGFLDGNGVRPSIGDPTSLDKKSNLYRLDLGSGASKQKARNYKCPTCGGEFNTWEEAVIEDGQVFIKSGTTPSMSPTVDVCPFCKTEKGEYNNEE